MKCNFAFQDFIMNNFNFWILILSLCAVATANDTKSDHHYHQHNFCMPHCSYVCMATPGKIETCANLLNPNNATMASLPNLAACPTTTAPIQDCMLKCGCQCTRCGVCLMKNMNVKAAMEECKAKPDPKKCIEDKKAEALKKCN